MTTPENFRRRQRLEGGALIALGLVTLLLGIYFHGQDVAQRTCLEVQVKDLSQAFGVRADLNERAGDVTTQVIKRVAKAQSQEDTRKALDTYLAKQHDLNRERESTPAPPYPQGSCSP